MATATIHLEVNHQFHSAQARFEQVNLRATEAMRNATDNAASLVAGEAAEAIPKKTRRTALTIEKSETETLPDGARISVGSSDKVAVILEDGSRAHVIRAHNGALRFIHNGQIIYRKQVFHPGTPPFLWMSRAYTLSLFPAQKMYEEEVAEAYRSVLGIAL